MFILDAVKTVKLDKEALKWLEPRMRDWPTFQRYTSEMSLEDVLIAFKYEMDRGRTRRNILDKLVGMYNRRAGDKNRAQVDRLLGMRADEAA